LPGQDEQFNEGEDSSGSLELHANEEANRAFARAGSNNAARIAMIAITTRSSMKVNAPSQQDLFGREGLIGQAGTEYLFLCDML
jgi:hypothetical protein